MASTECISTAIPWVKAGSRFCAYPSPFWAWVTALLVRWPVRQCTQQLSMCQAAQNAQQNRFSSRASCMKHSMPCRLGLSVTGPALRWLAADCRYSACQGNKSEHNTCAGWHISPPDQRAGRCHWPGRLAGWPPDFEGLAARGTCPWE